MDHVRAWKDPLYRASLSDEERQSLPAHPAGLVELSDSELNGANGGTAYPCATVVVTAAAGCYTWNATVCNGTCSFLTAGCCG